MSDVLTFSRVVPLVICHTRHFRTASDVFLRPRSVQVAQQVNQMMRRSSEMAAQSGECSMYRAVRDVVHGFTLPTEQPQTVAPPLGSDGGAPGGQMMMQQRQYQQQRPMTGMMPSMMGGGAGQPGPRDRMQ